jgi:membrane-anchored protein YejM (alkaline phosphatase superfamily)
MNSIAAVPMGARLEGAEASRSTGRLNVLARYFVVSYAAILVNASAFLRHVEYEGILTAIFVGAVLLTYSLLYLLPAFLPSVLAEYLLRLPGLKNIAAKRSGSIIVYGLALIGMSLLQVLLYTDRVVFDLYGFHFNGFVWNLIFTRGGLESLGGSNSTMWSFALIVTAMFAVQAILLAAVIGIPRVHAAVSALLKPRRIVLGLCLFAVIGIFERVTFGICSLRAFRPVLAASGAFPMYMPTSFTSLAHSMGVVVVRQPSLKIGEKSLRTAYPRKAVQRDPSVKVPNIVWLVSESLRADMVDAEIMPNTWKLAQEAVWCKDHYSGGNGTRMAMFSMFYGLYGCFWFPIFQEQRSPVLMDVVQEAGYQMEMYTSASFSYPEFDRTMFANIPEEKLHEAKTLLPWRRDRENVEDLIKFIDTRDPSKPFFTFMFFESPHAPYHFPQESVIRKPYVEDLNYATMNLVKDIVPIKNRYINACNHLDSQVGRVLTYLREHRLMESTIVLVTGDHGEEFMEHGRWGHNSGFTEEQTRPPLVLWVPGKGHQEITRMTSHLDIPATLMPLLGVTNPPQDLSLGYDLLGPTKRDFTIICDWNHVAYVDTHYKLVMPFNVYGFAEQTVSTRDDQPIKEMAAFAADNKQRLTRLMTDMKAFSR